jgi:hypothetical protein
MGPTREVFARNHGRKVHNPHLSWGPYSRVDADKKIQCVTSKWHWLRKQDYGPGKFTTYGVKLPL